MGEPNEVAEGVGAINLAGGGFWKPWAEVEENAPEDMKNPRLVRPCRRRLEVMKGLSIGLYHLRCYLVNECVGRWWRGPRTRAEDPGATSSRSAHRKRGKRDKRDKREDLGRLPARRTRGIHSTPPPISDWVAGWEWALGREFVQSDGSTRDLLWGL
eukprot:g27163.t1